MNKKMILLTLCLTVLFACNKLEPSTSGLKFVKDNYPLLPLDNIELYRQDTVRIGDEAYLKIIYADTIDGKKAADLNIRYFYGKDSFELYAYSQSWEDDQYRYILKIKEDTTSYYKKDKITKEFIFYIGEYDFKRTRNEVALTSFGDTTVKDDIIYYDLHRDSLRKVRGNNLPPLPSPTPEERDQWRAMQRERKDGINLDEF
jgi:uncharacterized protein YbcV (DUF1398 family)